MLKLREVWITVGIVALCVSAAFSSPIIDGTVNVGEYAEAVPDVYVFGAADESGEDYYGSGLDIDTLLIDFDGLSRYAAITVDPVAGGGDQPFDVNGSPASYTGQTAVNLAFYATQPDLSGPAIDPVYYLNLILSDSGLEQGELVEWNPNTGQWRRTLLTYGLVVEGGVPTFDPAMASKYDVAAGQALEIRLDEGLFLNAADSAQYVVAQLDDLGGWSDDQMTGHLPEPGTMVLLTLGATGLLARKRRRR